MRWWTPATTMVTAQARALCGPSLATEREEGQSAQRPRLCGPSLATEREEGQRSRFNCPKGIGVLPNGDLVVAKLLRRDGAEGPGESAREQATSRQDEREALKAADLLRVDVLLELCLAVFAETLTVFTPIESLVWAHQEGPEETRRIATDYFARHARQIKMQAKETMQLLKKRPLDGYHELVEALCD